MKTLWDGMKDGLNLGFSGGESRRTNKRDEMYDMISNYIEDRKEKGARIKEIQTHISNLMREDINISRISTRIQNLMRHKEVIRLDRGHYIHHFYSK